MVVLKPVGGIGNQLHIRAMGYALEALGNEVGFDLSYFKTDDTRAYALDRFNTEVNQVYIGGQEISEPDLTYHPELLKKYENDVRLSGYFQCPRYFEGVEDTIRKAFTLRNKPSDQTLTIAREIEACNSVFLHVRRTDSLAARGLAFHGVCSGEYYGRAVYYILKNVSRLKFFIFSDDIGWCKKNVVEFGYPLTYVDHNSTGVTVLPDNEVRKTDTGTEHEDLWLMSRCKHGICANSSFSWWANWLIQNLQKNCIAPRDWFTPTFNHLSADMIPDGWARL
jgi:hypothetical protein